MQIQKDDIIYFSHVLPKLNVYEVLEMKIRTVGVNWFVASSTKNHNNVYAFTDNDFNQIVFQTYQEAYEHMNRQKESEKC